MDDGVMLKERYGYKFAELLRLSTAPAVIDETNVLQEANPALSKSLWEVANDFLLPGSRIEGREHIVEFHTLLKKGKNCLILPEHYSNLDLPTISYLLDTDGGEAGKEIAERMVAIAGMKLTESNPAVKAWTEGFSRINIYPSRSLAAIQDPEERAREEARSKKINTASMRALNKVRSQGRPVLVFPSGTRYREGRPDTRRALREIDSYIRLFDYMIFVSINGSCLRINPAAPEDMLADTLHRDLVIVAASPVMRCKEFRAAIVDGVKDTPDIDPKQAVTDKITELLSVQHETYEKMRLADITRETETFHANRD